MALLSDNKTLSSLYGTYIVAIILNFMPSVMVQTIGGILFIATFIYTYIVRYRSKKETIENDHARYLIKTVWIFSLFTVIGIIIAYGLGDHSIIYQFMNDIMQNGLIPAEDQIMQILIDYTQVNLVLFALIFLPITLYLFYRFAKGMRAAQRNKKPDNLNSWF